MPRRRAALAAAGGVVSTNCKPESGAACAVDSENDPVKPRAARDQVGGAAVSTPLKCIQVRRSGSRWADRLLITPTCDTA